MCHNVTCYSCNRTDIEYIVKMCTLSELAVVVAVELVQSVDLEIDSESQAVVTQSKKFTQYLSTRSLSLVITELQKNNTSRLPLEDHKFKKML